MNLKVQKSILINLDLNLSACHKHKAISRTSLIGVRIERPKTILHLHCFDKEKRGSERRASQKRGSMCASGFAK